LLGSLSADYSEQYIIEPAEVRRQLSCIKYKKLISLQHRVRATKSHIQNSKSFFSGIMWQNDLIALTIHLTWPRLSFALPHYHASKETEIKQTLQWL